MIVRKLEYLIALAREGHFARAAAACGVSQPALSGGIQQLEVEMGVQIVKRGQRFQGLTAEGELILAWAQKTAAESKRLQQELRNRAGHSAGTLRLAALNSAGPLLGILLTAFEQQHPEASLTITGQNAFEIQHGLEECSSDVVITYLDKNPRRYLRSHPLYTEEYELLIRRGTELSGKPSVSWEDVKGLRLSLITPEMRILGTEEAELLSEARAGVPQITTNLILQVLRHVRTGQWASVLPKPVRIMIAGDDELEAIPLPPASEPVSVGVAIPNREPVPPLVNAFYEIATSREVLKKLDEALRPAPGSAHR